MSFYNLVENAEGYGYPRVGGPLKNHKTLNEKKNGWTRETATRKLIETTELNGQKGPFLSLQKPPTTLKQKGLRFQEQNPKNLSLKDGLNMQTA